MRFFLASLAISLGCSGLAIAASPADISDKSTHMQSSIVKIQSDDSMKINAFALDSKGLIVAVCGDGPGAVRVINDDGEILKEWEIDVRPESVNVSAEGSIFVGGEGKLFEFDANGKEIHSVDSPHADKLRNSKEELRKSAIAYLNRRRMPSSISLQSRISAYERIIGQLEKRAKDKELNASEKRMLESLPEVLDRYKEQLADLTEDEDEKEQAEQGPSEKEIEEQIARLTKTKMRISSITSTSDYVFVATNAIEGYGYDVWRMDRKFENGEVIITGLRGCCGQMDVQCCEQGIFVAENSRDRVVHFDFDGKEITHWGKSDRTGLKGFASCCNPMNVCFDKAGHIYTAEASIGRIKQFNAEGKLLAYVGDVDLVPGCKNVSIGVSPVNQNIYMLDLTRNHIKLMRPKPETETPDSPADTPDETTTTKKTPKRSIYSVNLPQRLASVLGLGVRKND